MARPVLRVIASLLIPIVEIAPNVEFNARFNGKFVRADAPVDFGLLAGVEAINVDKLGEC